jgi:hypothetical protein
VKNILMSFLSNRKSLMKFGKWSLAILSLALLGFFVVNFTLPVFAALESDNVTLVTPSNNSYQRGAITVNVTSVTDVINASFYYTNTTNNFFYSIGTNTSCDNTKKICTYSWNTASGVTDGNYNFTVNVTNSTWTYNVTKTNTNITVDNTAPTVALTAPSNNAYLKGSWINITGTASDINNATIVTNDTHFATMGGTYASWNFTNTSALTDGVYHVQITANDSAGNSNSVIANFTVDNISPILNNVTPANNSYIQGNSAHLFQVDVSDSNLNTSNVSLEYKFTGDLSYTRLGLTCYGASPSFVCNNTLNPNKDTGVVLYYYFEATDNATNYANNGTSSSPLAVTIDNVNPTYTNWAANVTDGATIRKGTIIGLSAQWNDNYVLDKYLISRNDTTTWVNETAVAFPAGNWSNVTIDTSGFAVGTYFQAKMYANDSANNTNATSAFGWTIDGTAPTYTNNNTNDTDNVIGKYDSILLYANWSDNIGLNYAWLETNETAAAVNKTGVYGSPLSMTSGQTWSNFSWSNSSMAAGSVIAWRIFVNDTSGNTNSTPLLTFTIDGTAPTYANNVTSVANGTQYAPGAKYGFQADFTDNLGVDTVIFEWNGTNSTGSNLGSMTNYTYRSGAGQVSKTGSTYYFNSTDLSGGIYQYRWYANDTSGNWNNSHPAIAYYVIVNATNPVNLYLNGTLNQNLTVTYPAQVNATGVALYSNSGTVKLWRNGTDVTSAENGQNVRLSNATWPYQVNITGSINYTANNTGATFYAFVLKATPTVTLSALPGWTNAYPASTNVSCSVSSLNDEVSVKLWRNGTDVTSTENNVFLTNTSMLIPGVYNYTCGNASGTGNYSAYTTQNIMTIGVAGTISGYIKLTNTTTGLSSVSVTYGTIVASTISSGYYYLTGMTAGTYTVTASKDGYYTNSGTATVTDGATTQVNISMTGPENYNVTIPAQEYHSFWTSGWHNFWLSTRPFTSVTNYNFTSLFSSISGNYTAIYRDVSGTWQTYIVGESSNDFYNISSSDYLYWIYANNTDRVEVEPIHIIT